MLLLLTQWLAEDIRAFNVFNYITLRAVLATLTALLISFVVGPAMIRKLTAYKIGQWVRDDGLKTHLSKAGTPTMGGALILSSIGISTLLWADLHNRYVWTVLLVTLLFGAIGWVDDYRKVIEKNSKGLPSRWKYFWQSVFGLGAAIFLFITGRGAVSIDRVLRQQRALKVPEAPAVALTLLRICMGVGIAFGALTEKLLDPGLAGALLTERPYLNVVAGLGVSNGQFAYLAGLTELVIGLVIVSGQLTRLVMAIGAVLFTVTLPIFGWLELLGHLPYYGIMLTLFIAPSADPRQVRTQLREGRAAA